MIVVSLCLQSVFESYLLQEVRYLVKPFLINYMKVYIAVRPSSFVDMHIPG